MNMLCGWTAAKTDDSTSLKPRCPFAIDGQQWRSHKVTVEATSVEDNKNLARHPPSFFKAPCQKICYCWEVIRNTWHTIVNRASLDQARVTHTRNLSKQQVERGQFEDVVDYRSLVIDTYSIADPSINLSIVQNYRNGDGENALFSGGIGVDIVAGATGKNNLFTCPASQHKKLREFLDPFFEFTEMQKHIGKFETQSKEYIRRWCSEGSHTVNVTRETHRFGLEAIAKNFLGFKVSTESIQTAIDTFRDYGVLKGMVKSSMLNYIFNLIWNCDKKLKDAAKAIDDAVQGVIANSNPADNNLLQAMQKAKDANGDHLFTKEEIQDTVKILFFAGQETTASLLTYLIYQLGLHPEWRDNIRKELEDMGDKPLSYKIVNSKALNYVFTEGLRLNPPAPIIGRTAIKDVAVKCPEKDYEFFAEKNRTFVCDNYFSGRDVRRWGENAEEFDPSRHANKNHDTGPQLWFGEGPNRCIGRQFATLEIKTFLAVLVQELDWTVETQKVRQVEELSTQIEAVPQEKFWTWLWHKITFNSPSKDIFVRFTKKS